MSKVSSFRIIVLSSLLFVFVSRLEAQAGAPQDAALLADVQKALHHKQFSQVQVAVANGVVTLTGTVDIYNDKRDAERKAHRGGDTVVDQVTVNVSQPVSDETLQAKIGQQLIYDRVGYGTTVYNSFRLQVKQGVATVGGVVYGPQDELSALDLIANTRGIRDVVDNIQVAPPSPIDDRIRRATYQAIYGYPSLNRYAIDPAKTIRITVVNGNITLTGIVDNEADKNLVYLRANGVAGAFSVKNELQVQGSQPGK